MYEISVVVPVYNEEKFIETFYRSLLKQENLQRDKVEVLFIDGNSTDGTLRMLEALRQEDSGFRIRILPNEKRHISAALNIGLEKSAGNYIIRLDVHSAIPTDYISRIYRELAANSSEYCNFGGRTNAKGYDNTSTIVAKALSSKWVIGGAQFRYAKQKMEVDSIFPGAWLKTDLQAIGGWDEHWIINEDAELNFRLRKATNKKIVLDPDIVIHYFPRNTLKKLAKQYFNYGFWRAKTAKRHEESMRLSHLLPLFSLMFLLFSITLAFVHFQLFSYFLFTALVAYVVFLMAIAHAIFDKKERLLGMAAIFVIQSTWILGAFKGYIVFGFPLKGYSRLLIKLLASKWKLGRKEMVN